MALRRGRPASRWSGLPWAAGLTCVLTVWLVAPAGAAGPRKPVALAAEATAKTLSKCTFAALQRLSRPAARSSCVPRHDRVHASGDARRRVGDPRRLGLVRCLRRPGKDAAVRRQRRRSDIGRPHLAERCCDRRQGCLGDQRLQRRRRRQRHQRRGRGERDVAGTRRHRGPARPAPWDAENGTNGSPAPDGGDGQGGAIYVAAGAKLTIAGDTFKANVATGGAGGAGGKGGAGGRGGFGGSGGSGGDGASAKGAPGGNGADGGAATDGGKGGNGGPARTQATEATARAAPSTARARSWS